MRESKKYISMAPCSLTTRCQALAPPISAAQCTKPDLKAMMMKETDNEARNPHSRFGVGRPDTGVRFGSNWKTGAKLYCAGAGENDRNCRRKAFDDHARHDGRRHDCDVWRKDCHNWPVKDDQGACRCRDF